MFYGWWIVIIAFFSTSLVGATIWYGFTAFFDPLVNEFAWSYTAISLAASFRGIESGLMDIFIGFLTDRFGGRRIAFIGLMLFGIGFLMLSRINSLSTFYISFLVILIGAGGISLVVFFQVITRWFRKRLGLALGFAATGVGAGGFAVPLIVYLIDLVGFRMVFIIIGITALIIGCFAGVFLRSHPKDMGINTDRIPLAQDEHEPELSSQQTSDMTTTARDYTIKETALDPSFWIITFVSSAMAFSAMMVATHIMPYLEHIGHTRYTASIMAMMIPVTSIAGRLGVGWLSDLINRKITFILVVAMQTIGVWLFLNAYVAFFLISSVILIGVSYGGVIILRPGILRDYYGSTNIGTIIGLCFGLTGLGSIGGPLLAGWIFDTTSSYHYAWIITAILLIVNIPLILLIKKREQY